MDGKAGGWVVGTLESPRAKERTHEKAPGRNQKAHGMASPTKKTWGTATLGVLRVKKKELENHITNQSD